MIPALDVYLPASLFDSDERGDIRVGTCRFSLKRGQVNCAFAYDHAYLLRNGAFGIDPHIPLNSTSHYSLGLPGVLRDSSPDRWGRHLIARRQAHAARAEGASLRTLDEVDYLIGVHDMARQGALRLAVPGSSLMLSAEGKVPPIVELKRLLAASNGLILEGGSESQVKELLDAGSGSLGGARPKATVVDGGKLLMAKFSHPGDEWDVIAWEKVVLDLASKAGIAVPKSKFLRIASDSALVLERFDRREGLLAGERIPYISAMSLLGAQDGEQRDYVEVAEELAVCSGDPSRELRRLFVRVAFSVLMHNTDDHLKNLGFLYFKGGWELAPMFDVNINPDTQRCRVTSVYGESGRGEVEALHELASSCGLDEGSARELVRGLLKAAMHARTVARKAGCPERELDLMLGAVQQKAADLKDSFGL